MASPDKQLQNIQRNERIATVGRFIGTGLLLSAALMLFVETPIFMARPDWEQDLNNFFGPDFQTASFLGKNYLAGFVFSEALLLGGTGIGAIRRNRRAKRASSL